MKEAKNVMLLLGGWVKREREREYPIIMCISVLNDQPLICFASSKNTSHACFHAAMSNHKNSMHYEKGSRLAWFYITTTQNKIISRYQWRKNRLTGGKSVRLSQQNVESHLVETELIIGYKAKISLL